jgi:hypothetical protein
MNLLDDTKSIICLLIGLGALSDLYRPSSWEPPNQDETPHLAPGRSSPCSSNAQGGEETAEPSSKDGDERYL